LTSATSDEQLTALGGLLYQVLLQTTVRPRVVEFLDHGFNISLMLFYYTWFVQCHYSYSACGLGSDGTNRLVQLVQGMQHNKSNSEDGTLYGAKITGGGSGGTVCVVGRNSLRSSQQILEVCKHTRDSKVVGT